MRIELRVHGGFAGIRRAPLVLETDELEPDAKHELEALAAGLPAGGAPGRGADYMTYDVRVADASGTRSARYCEPDVPDEVRALLRLARQAAGGP